MKFRRFKGVAPIPRKPRRAGAFDAKPVKPGAEVLEVRILPANGTLQQLHDQLATVPIDGATIITPDVQPGS